MCVCVCCLEQVDLSGVLQPLPCSDEAERCSTRQKADLQECSGTTSAGTAAACYHCFWYEVNLLFHLQMWYFLDETESDHNPLVVCRICPGALVSFMHTQETITDSLTAPKGLLHEGIFSLQA